MMLNIWSASTSLPEAARLLFDSSRRNWAIITTIVALYLQDHKSLSCWGTATVTHWVFCSVTIDYRNPVRQGGLELRLARHGTGFRKIDPKAHLGGRPLYPCPTIHMHDC